MNYLSDTDEEGGKDGNEFMNTVAMPGWIEEVNETIRDLIRKGTLPHECKNIKISNTAHQMIISSTIKRMQDIICFSYANNRDRKSLVLSSLVTALKSNQKELGINLRDPQWSKWTDPKKKIKKGKARTRNLD